MAANFEIGLNNAQMDHLARQGMNPHAYIKKLINDDMERNPPPEGSLRSIMKPLARLNEKVSGLSAAVENVDQFQVAEDCLHLAYEIKHGLEAVQNRVGGVK